MVRIDVEINGIAGVIDISEEQAILLKRMEDAFLVWRNAKDAGNEGKADEILTNLVKEYRDTPLGMGAFILHKARPPHIFRKNPTNISTH